jgi:hypothetical protein
MSVNDVVLPVYPYTGGIHGMGPGYHSRLVSGFRSSDYQYALIPRDRERSRVMPGDGDELRVIMLGQIARDNWMW